MMSRVLITRLFATSRTVFKKNPKLRELIETVKEEHWKSQPSEQAEVAKEFNDLHRFTKTYAKEQELLKQPAAFGSPNAEMNPHAYFYRVLLVPFLKVSAFSLGTYYTMVYLWEFLEESEKKSDELIATK